MTPREPHRRPQLGFLYLPPYRVQGLSIAGEETVVQIPELDVVFDIGRCPRAALTSPYCALSHGHMDHSAGLPYYFSQRQFQGMGTGTCICHPDLAPLIHDVMQSFMKLEGQKTPYEVAPLAPDDETLIKPNIHLRAFKTAHTPTSLGYVAVERRTKLLPELAGLPQEQIMARKEKGEPITREVEIPLVCFTGDTMWGDHFDRPDVLQAKVMIVECTFLEPGHKSRAAVGMHLHLSDVVNLLSKCEAEAVVLTHLSRRTNIGAARKHIDEAIPAEHRDRVFVLMDGRTNRARLDQQKAEAEAEAAEAATPRV